MPYAIALALTETGFETRLSQNSVRFHGRYALMPEYGGLVNDAVEGDRLAEAVADGVRVVLLANHGVLVIGESLAHAWEDLYFFERACMVQVLAQSTREPLRLMDIDVAELTVKQYDGERYKAEILLAATRRLVDRSCRATRPDRRSERAGAQGASSTSSTSGSHRTGAPRIGPLLARRCPSPGMRTSSP